MISMQMCDKDALDLARSDTAIVELSRGSVPAIEYPDATTEMKCQGGDVSVGSADSRACSKEF